MAEAMLSYTWPTGEQLVASLELDDSFPQTAAEATANCVRMFASGMGVVRAYDIANADVAEVPPTEAGE
jgi:hypothetical protein